MNKEKLKLFLKELAELQEKHGIYVSATYEEHVDYNWDEEPYVSGVSAYLIFSDTDGNEMSMDNLDIDDI